MAEFDPAIELVLEHEGGYVNHPSDPGGETNFGITKRSYPDLDIRSLTREEAKAIYRRDFWRFDGVRDQRVANKCLDTLVNFGVGGGSRLIQKAAGVKQDGVIGPVTLGVINSLDPDKFLAKLREARIRYRFQRVKEKPSQMAFLEGWCVRDAC